MATIRRLEDLEAWQEAKKLCKGIYEITKTFPKSEKYNIVKHLRESGRGVMGNIGEGFGRYFYRESMRFYDIAQGCLREVKSDIHLSYDVGYISKEMFSRFIKQIEKVDSKINGLICNTKIQMNNNKK
ncbi:four helix bundle protein [Patescibacteria group bacterium]|nr:four helix bundle protein [Candidatus Falkowbacteria bacterium]MBU3905678.1 four helix bundle protein [Patescibacteria group bacterium]MCG2697949.1 four helix bundle protein [Candidatus Parcubacteria bacterium]MBU4015012.1 four helix bundle protein [Patescibacteria group bacterium]MBU4026452.1 four helix bundle protein [Patescibacteria group bacterium]